MADLSITNRERFKDVCGIVRRVMRVDSLQRRNRRATFARSMATYLLRVRYGLSLRELGLLFDCVDSTIVYSCALIENERDDPDIDALVTEIEAMLDRKGGGTNGVEFQGRTVRL